jgi:hypothetical protein
MKRSETRAVAEAEPPTGGEADAGLFRLSERSVMRQATTISGVHKNNVHYI